MAGKLSVPSLTRAWQMLLKGLFEVRDATRPIAAAEMALIRLSYAADLPPTDKLVRDVMDGAGAPPARNTSPSPPSSGGNVRAQAVRVGESSVSAQRAPEPTANAQSAPLIRSLEDLAALAQANNSPVLKVNIENDIHLVRLEPGQLEFRPSARAPRTLAADLAQKLKDWTGTRWMVTVAREGGAPSIAEARRLARDATFDRVRQEPLVRAVLDRFPGAEIVAVRDLVEEEIAAPTEEDAS
jgi:DNA polymerase-3 subunit gamma/tau